MGNALALRPDAQLAIERMRDTAQAVTAIVEIHPLDTPEAEDQASQMLRAIKTLIAEGEGFRKDAKAPHLAAGRAVDAAFRAPRAALERVEKLIKRRLGEAAERREAERQAALQLARDAAAVNDYETVNTALEKVDIAGLDSAPEGISTRWTYEVESVELRSVPIEFLCLDTARVRAEIRTANQEGRPPSIAGVVFRKVAGIAARRL